MHDEEFVKLVDAAWFRYVNAEAIFRRSLDAESDRLFLIAKAITLRNTAFDRYKEAVEQSIINNS